MEFENLINNFSAFLASIIMHDDDGYTHPEILFLSRNEVQFIQSSGCIPTNKVYESNPLVKIFSNIVHCYFNIEEKNYLETLYTEDEEAGIAFDEQNIYNPNIIPEHIYHSMRHIKEILEVYENITGDITRKERLIVT